MRIAAVLPAALLALLIAACGGDTATSRPATPLTSSPETPEPLTSLLSTPMAGVWTPRSTLSTPRAEVASAVLDGRIYVIGGYEASGNNSNVVEVVVLPALPPKT